MCLRRLTDFNQTHYPLPAAKGAEDGLRHSHMTAARKSAKEPAFEHMRRTAWQTWHGSGLA
jgi:hypothetical protein